MKKIILCLLIITISLTICGCKNNSIEKITLDDKYHNTGGFIKTNNSKINKLIKNKESFILFVYNNYCTLPIPCEDIFNEYMNKNKIRFLSIPFKDFKKLKLYKKIKYAPSIIIINKGKVISYLDAESDNDFNKYQNIDEFSKWISKYVK